MSEPEIVQAIEKVKALCLDYYEDGYRMVSMRSALIDTGYTGEDQISAVLEYVADRGFSYCLDRTIECSSGSHRKAGEPA